jgi:general secretion pathway protein J
MRLKPVGRLKTQEGFTLLEILIAASMFAVLLTILFGTYSTSLSVMDKAGADSEVYDMARMAIDRISEDLESCFLHSPPAETDAVFGRVFGAFEGRKSAVGGYDADFLRFLSRARVVLDGSGKKPVESEIIYDARELEAGETLALFRIDTPFGTSVPDEGTGGYVLCERLIGINFTYHRGDEELDTWNSTEGDTSGIIPDRVTVKLSFEDPADSEMPLVFTTEVAIPSSRQQNGETTG